MGQHHRWTQDELEDAMALRRRGLSYGGIAIALNHYYPDHGGLLDRDRVRKVLRANGFPAEPRHSRAFGGVAPTTSPR